MISVDGFSPAVSGLYARTYVKYVTCNPSPVLLASDKVTAFTIDYRILYKCGTEKALFRGQLQESRKHTHSNLIVTTSLVSAGWLMNA